MNRNVLVALGIMVVLGVISAVLTYLRAEKMSPVSDIATKGLAAVQRGIPVLIVAHSDSTVSRLLLGLPGLVVARYSDTTSLCAAVERFSAGLLARPAAALGRPAETA